MNKFDERYEIRLASYEDIADIMAFIDEHWKKGHILAKDRGLFEYEFLNGRTVNMVLAIDKERKLIEGLFGFIYCSCPNEKRKPDIWGSLWKINEKHKNEPFLGVELIKRLYGLIEFRMHIGSGANPKTTIPLRKRIFGDKVGRMKQYYCLNPLVKEYHICKIAEANYLTCKEPQNLHRVVGFTNIEELKAAFHVEALDTYPFKDNWYIGKRYYNHPYYKYQVWGLEEKQGVTAVVVCRVVKVEEVKVLRIVDYIGKHEIFSETGEFWKKQMELGGYEYIDFYEFGMEEHILCEAGFACRTDGDVNVIPNYFEPFLQENVDIWVHYQREGTNFFKADSDQDRPNLLR